jgi:hypothetical protein
VLVSDTSAGGTNRPAESVQSGRFRRALAQSPARALAPNGQRVVWDLMNIFRFDDRAGSLRSGCGNWEIRGNRLPPASLEREVNCVRSSWMGPLDPRPFVVISDRLHMQMAKIGRKDSLLCNLRAAPIK